MEVYNNKFKEGDVNRIKRETQYINLHCSSMFRTDYYNSKPSDFTYTIPTPIKNIVSVSLASIDIPNSWYLISHSKGNNYFTIEINSQYCKCEVHDIVIPDGNYDVKLLTSYLNNTYFHLSKTETLLKYVKFSIHKHSLKTSFEVLNNDKFTDLKLNLKFVNKDNENIMETFGWILGFRYGQYLDIEECILSEGLYDGGGDRFIYFCLTDFNNTTNEHNIVCFDKTSVNKDIMAKIYIHNGKFHLNIDENHDNSVSFTKTRLYNGPINFKKIRVQLLDQFGNIIDLNNMDFSFTLQLEKLYENIFA